MIVINPTASDHKKDRPNKKPTTDQNPINVAKVQQPKTIYLFSTVLVDFLNNFTLNAAVSTRAGTLSVYVSVKEGRGGNIC